MLRGCKLLRSLWCWNFAAILVHRLFVVLAVWIAQKQFDEFQQVALGFRRELFQCLKKCVFLIRMILFMILTFMVKVSSTILQYWPFLTVFHYLLLNIKFSGTMHSPLTPIHLPKRKETLMHTQQIVVMELFLPMAYAI